MGLSSDYSRSARRRRRTAVRQSKLLRGRGGDASRPVARARGVRDEDRGQGGGVWGDRHEPSRAERSIGVRHRTIEPLGVVFSSSRIAPGPPGGRRPSSPTRTRTRRRAVSDRRTTVTTNVTTGPSVTSRPSLATPKADRTAAGENETNSVTNSRILSRRVRTLPRRRRARRTEPDAPNGGPTRTPPHGRRERYERYERKSRNPEAARSLTASRPRGGSAGAAKENQDAHFHLDNSLGYEASRDGYEASDSSDGAHNFVAGVLDGHGVAGAKVSSFVCAKNIVRDESEIEELWVFG